MAVKMGYAKKHFISESQGGLLTGILCSGCVKVFPMDVEMGHSIKHYIGKP